MFEKEAKKYQEEVITKKDYPHSIALDWQRGAEFGFQKGIKAKINTTTISDCPIKDEWHDLRKNPNDLPTNGKFILANNILSTEYVQFKNEKDGNHWRHDMFELYNVVYWKEVVLPKE